MAEEHRNDQPDKNLAAETRPIPSQAEGEEERGAPGRGTRPVPSQAEGDRETVEQDLKQRKLAVCDPRPACEKFRICLPFRTPVLPPRICPPSL